MPLQRFTRRTGRGVLERNPRPPGGWQVLRGGGRPKSLTRSTQGSEGSLAFALPPLSGPSLRSDHSACVLFEDALQFVRSLRAWSCDHARLDSSHGVHRFPFARHRHCVHSRSDRAPEEALSSLRIEPTRFDRVPFMPFLPAPTSCSAADPLAETRRSLAARRFVAPCSRPWGSPCFQRVVALRLRRPRGRHGLRPKSEIVSRHPRWRRPFEAFPSPAASLSSPPSSEEDGVHRQVVPSRRWSQGAVRFPCHGLRRDRGLGRRFRDVDLKALLHRRVRRVSRRCRPKTPDAPMGF